MVFDQFAMAAQAASAGLGAALLPRFLIDRELAMGELVIAIDQPITWHGPQPAKPTPPLAAFRQWLEAEAAGFADG